jgi:DNA-binding transcriptional LysR family regulator
VAAPGQPLSERKTVRTPDLEGESILLSEVDCSYQRTLERLLNEAGVANENVHIFHSVEALKRCVIKGAGITILSEVAVRENLAEGDLIALNWEEQGFDAALIMIWYGERWRSPALEAFMSPTRDVPRGYYEGS